MLTRDGQLRYLDESNLKNAYVSGLKEDIMMVGNDYTYAVSNDLLIGLFAPSPLSSLRLISEKTTAYTVAYAVMQIPSTLIVQKIRPSYWLAFMEIGWGVFTLAQAGMSNVSQLYAFRALVGFFESSFFPVMLFILGSW